MFSINDEEISPSSEDDNSESYHIHSVDSVFDGDMDIEAVSEDSELDSQSVIVFSAGNSAHRSEHNN